MQELSSFSFLNLLPVHLYYQESMYRLNVHGGYWRSPRESMNVKELVADSLEPEASARGLRRSDWLSDDGR